MVHYLMVKAGMDIPRFLDLVARMTITSTTTRAQHSNDYSQPSSLSDQGEVDYFGLGS